MNLQGIQSALQSADEETRRSALKSLASVSLDDSFDVVAIAMGDESWRVRKEAVEVFLCSTPDINSIEKLLDLLRNEDNAGLRNSAAEAVIRLGALAAQPLIEKIADPDADVRKFVIDVMGAIGDPLFLHPILGCLYDPDVNVASAAAEHLGSLGDSRAAADLIKAIVAHQSVLFRFSALEALGKLAKPGPVPEEIVKLADQDILRKAVYDCLGSISDETSVPLLLNGFSCLPKSARAAAVKALYRIYRRSDPGERQKIVDSLSSLKGGEVVQGLLELFDIRKTQLTEVLIWCSQIIADVRFVPLLLETFVIDSFAEAALMSLKTFGQAGMAEAVSRYSAADENARSALCMLIGTCGYTDYGDLLVNSLKDNSSSVRKSAAIAVGKLGLVSVASDLLALLDDSSADVCSAAVASLQRFASLDRAAAVNMARRLSDSELAHHRRCAALILSTLGESERLLLLVNDEDSHVRSAALSCLGSLSAEGAFRVLVMALSDADPDVRITAADALGRMKDVAALEYLEKSLEDVDVWVQCAAMKAIDLIAPDRFLMIAKRMHAQSGGLLMITCLQLLEGVADPEAQSILRSALESSDRDVAMQAKKSLERSLTVANG